MKFAIALVAVVGVAEATRYKSGAVTGFEKFTYGKFITRMKAPDKKGTVSSFFTYWNGPGFYPGGWNELDVEIVPSVSENPFSMNIIYGDGHQKHESHDYKNGFDPKDAWHIYEMAWTPEYIAWSIDNKEVRRVASSDPSVKAITKGQSVMMNFWTPTFDSWGKGFNAADMPWYVLYDYVETYTYNQETNGFDFHWRDDFESLDPRRWHKSDNTTFDANSTTFRASQSYIDSGHLVLKMEPDHVQKLHPGQHYIPTKVVPVQTEPAYEHKVSKGEKEKKGDAHYDVLEEQHRSHFEHQHQEHEQPHQTPQQHHYSYYEPTPSTYYHSRELESPEDIAFDYYARTRRHTSPAGDHQAYHEIGGTEAHGAHIDLPVTHVDTHHKELKKPHPELTHAELAHHEPVPHHLTPHIVEDKKKPIVKAAHFEEPHVSSTPGYYDQMFRHNSEAFNSSEINQTEDAAFEQEENIAVRGHLKVQAYDQTPYEHVHSGYDARFRDGDKVPHLEVKHDDYGVQERSLDQASMDLLPTYDDLLWAYQHGGFHHADAEGEIHHEDVAIDESETAIDEDPYYGYHQHRAFDPYIADKEYVLDHGDLHPAHHGYHKEHDERMDWRGESQIHAEQSHYQDHGHHTRVPFWRRDHYDVHEPISAHHGSDDYNHDVNKHHSKQMMHDIESEYDELFHMIESKTKHPIEHRDVVYKTLPFDGIEQQFDDENEDGIYEEVYEEDANDQPEIEKSHHQLKKGLYFEENETYYTPYHDSAPVIAEDHRIVGHHTDMHYARIEPVYHRPIYHDPVIHGSRGKEEYHELNREPFGGDYLHGDLHFEPFSASQEELLKTYNRRQHQAAAVSQKLNQAQQNDQTADSETTLATSDAK